MYRYPHLPCFYRSITPLYCLPFNVQSLELCRLYIITLGYGFLVRLGSYLPTGR